MPILYRHMLKEILRVAAIVLVTVVAVYLAVDFFEKIDDFFETGVPVVRALAYFGYKLPFVVAQMLPLCLLLSVLIAFGLMNKHNEVLALRAGGVGAGRLLRPALALGLCGSLALFFLAEGIVPFTMDRANRIWLGEVRQAPLMVSRERNIWVRGEQTISHIRYYHPPSRTARGITVNRFDPAFRLVARWDAAAGRYRDGHWALTDVMAQRMDPRTHTMAVRFHPTLRLALGLTPADLEQAVRDSSEMSLPELRRYAAKVAAEGYDATPYRVDLHAKMAFPAVCLILAVVGASIGLHRRVHDGLALAVAVGLGVAFLYWVFYSFCLSLGYGQMLPPPLAAWAANLVFACLAAVLTLSTE